MDLLRKIAGLKAAGKADEAIAADLGVSLEWLSGVLSANAFRLVALTP